jgi:hypothetical protein
MREIPPPAKHQYVQELRDNVNQCKSLVDDFLFRVMQDDKTVRTQTPMLPFLINSTEMRKKRLEIQERAKENAAAAGRFAIFDYNNLIFYFNPYGSSNQRILFIYAQKAKLRARSEAKLRVKIYLILFFDRKLCFAFLASHCPAT